jgi:hypothetical protein
LSHTCQQSRMKDAQPISMLFLCCLLPLRSAAFCHCDRCLLPLLLLLLLPLSPTPGQLHEQHTRPPKHVLTSAARGCTPSGTGVHSYKNINPPLPT